jgi:hypothetical protein
MSSVKAARAPVLFGPQVALHRVETCIFLHISLSCEA